MNKNIRNGLMVLSITILMSGCGGNNGKGKGGSTAIASSDLPNNVQTAIDDPVSDLSQVLKNTLSYMGNEERLSYDVYNRLYKEWGINQFTNIPTKSEYKHITAVQQLVQKYKMNDSENFTNVDLSAQGYENTSIEKMKAGIYDISKIQKLYDDLITQGMTSEIEALKVGCTVEVVDVEDLDAYIQIAKESNAEDIVTVFNYLRDGSYNHYWAFDKGLKKRGQSQGCCTWSELCHTEYPQKEKGKK